MRSRLKPGFTVPLALAVVVGLGCPSGDPDPTPGDDDDFADDDDVAVPDELDFGFTIDITLGEDFTAQIRVPGFGGIVTFFHTGGELPGGLRVTANGVIEGAPTEVGEFLFSITATNMTIPDIVDEATLVVLLSDLPLHLAVVHDRPTTLTKEERNLQRDPWMRIQAEGDPAWTEITLDVAEFHPGANAENEGGWGDDIRMETVPIGECTITPGKWILPDDTDCNPDDRPPHCVDDDPMTYEGKGRFVTGDDTGHLEVHVDCGARGAVDIRVMAVPPGWCPLGDHYGGPPWQTPGACEPD
jgi:hypothetical protein